MITWLPPQFALQPLQCQSGVLRLCEIRNLVLNLYSDRQARDGIRVLCERRCTFVRHLQNLSVATKKIQLKTVAPLLTDPVESILDNIALI